jgi:NADH:ubiquinone reductase (H+-translocating)
MATISRFRAVANIGPLRFGGLIAWLIWLFIHVLYLVGFKNRVTTVLHWAVSFIGRGRGQRTIYNASLQPRTLPEAAEEPPSERATPVAGVRSR